PPFAVALPTLPDADLRRKRVGSGRRYPSIRAFRTGKRASRGARESHVSASPHGFPRPSASPGPPGAHRVGSGNRGRTVIVGRRTLVTTRRTPHSPPPSEGPEHGWQDRKHGAPDRDAGRQGQRQGCPVRAEPGGRTHREPDEEGEHLQGGDGGDG